ncbi:MAG: leucine-rich repeat domain-containing protein [bacterium]
MKKILILITLCGVWLGFNTLFTTETTTYTPEINTNTRLKTGDSITDGDLTFTVIDSATKPSVSVKSSKTNEELQNLKIVIPSKVYIDNQSHDVVEIAKDGFKDLTKLQEVIFPDTLEKINSSAFLNSGLTTLTINTPSLISLGSNSFGSCTNLKSVDFSNTSIDIFETDVFDKSINVETFNIRNTQITSIPTNAFTSFTSLQSIDLSSSPIETIGNSAFKDLSKLNSVKLPEGLLSIGSFAFSGCTSLDVLEVPSSVTTIKDDAFAIGSNENNTDKVIYLHSPYNEGMTAHIFDNLALECVIVVKEENYVNYKDKYFDENITYQFDLTIELNDYNLNTDKFQNEITIKRLNNKPFNYVLNEETLIWSIDESLIVTSILPIGSELSKNIDGYEYRTNGYILSNNENLEKDTILTSETIITPTFEAYYLTSFENGEYTIIGVSQYWTFNTVTVIPEIYNDGINGNYPVIVIGESAFLNRDFISLKFSNGITTISDNAFENITTSSLTLPDTLISIGANSFYNASINGVLTIPNSVFVIGNSAFENSHLNHVYLNDATELGSDIFKNTSKVAGGADPIIIAVSVSSYERIKDLLNTEFLTHLVSIQLDYNGGVVDRNPVVLTRLYNYSIEYVQNNDLTWSQGSYTIPIPTKTDYKFLGWYNGTEELLLSTIFTEDVTYTALYNVLTIISDVSTGGLDSKIYSADGMEKDAVVSILKTNDSTLNDIIPKKADIYGTYTVNFTLNGENYKPQSNAYLFSIKLPTDIATVNEYTVYAIGADGQLEEIKAAVSHGYIVFYMTDIKDFALVNVPLEQSMSIIILVLIFIFVIVNGIQLILIAYLNRKKQKNIVTYSIAPIFILALHPNVFGWIILAALIITAVTEFIYILYLFLTRNNSIYVNQLPEPNLELPNDATVSVEDLEDLLNQTHETIESLGDDISLEEYVDDEIEVFIDEEPVRQMMSLDDLDDGEEDNEVEVEEDDNDEEEEVRTRMSETGQLIVIKFKKSFTARLNLTEDLNKDYYTIVKNKLLSFRKINSRISWHHEAFNFGRSQAAKINVRGRTLFVYLPLDPEDYIDTKYTFKDCSHIKKYEQLPFRIKIKSKRALQYALELIDIVMGNFETTEKKRFEPVNYYQKNRGFEKLLKEGLIKEIITSEVTETITETVIKTKTNLNTQEVVVEKSVEVIESQDKVQKEITDEVITSVNPNVFEEKELNIVEEDEEEVDLNIEEDNEHKKKFIDEITETKTITTVISTPTQTVSTTQNLSPNVTTTEVIEESVLVPNPPIKLPPINSYDN